jgi:predicted enzyme related to lactoylglutathione lyase
MWTYYFGVEDIDRAAEAVKAGGGQVVNGPMEIPGGEFAVNAIDPDGAAFGLVGPRK